MIKKIELKNFKCFDSESIRLKHVNMLSGLNGMGKSTLIQMILLLRQSYKINGLKEGLNLTGEWIDLGLGKDVLNEKADDQTIQFRIEEDDWNLDIAFEYMADSNMLMLKEKLSDQMLENLPKSSIFNDKFIYLSSMRIGPRNFYNLSNITDISQKSFGKDGEFSIQYLKLHGSDIVKNKNLQLSDDGDYTLNTLVGMWLDKISPGANTQIEINQLLNISELRYEYIEGKEKTNSYKSINVGFGLTYVLPVIVALLVSQKDDLVILENPEAHIHPAGQRMLGELISRAGSSGAQIIVETHSDHILNGIRLSVKKHLIDHNDIALPYFYKDEMDNFRHKIVYPQIDRHGKMDMWPEGFFDEWDKALFGLI